MKTEKRVGRFLEFEADSDLKLSNSFPFLGGLSASPSVAGGSNSERQEAHRRGAEERPCFSLGAFFALLAS